LHGAYETALRALFLVNRSDPVTEIAANNIVEVGQTGIRDPAQISTMAAKALGLP
jgi:hypothetical protein